MEAEGENLLGDYRKQIVGGETRYYADDTHYAIYARVALAVRWYEVRSDGDYHIATYSSGKRTW